MYKRQECIIDPGSGSLLTVAFVSDASKSIVYYHVYDPASNTWPIRIRFVDIASLKICSETEVRNDANNVLPRCDIDPTAPGALNQALVLAIPTAPPDPRFFRFKIEGIAVKGVRTPTLQSSFTLRNPTAFTVANSSNGSISYICLLYTSPSPRD